MATTDDAVPADPLTVLRPVFAPDQAAEILRHLGLVEMTACALRTRAYRRQIPFHRNGNRITFTLTDLQEIAEGEPQRPEPHKQRRPKPPTVPPQRRPRKRPVESSDPEVWRARRRL